MLKPARVFVVAAGISSLTMSSATAEPLRSNTTLRISFTSSPVLFPFGPPDLLQLDFGFFNIIEPFGSRSATLFDGRRPLGTYTTSYQGTDTGIRGNVFSTWVSATSSYTFLDPTVIDFTSIGNQTIRNGVIDFRISAGLVDIDLSRISLFLGKSDHPAGYSYGNFSNPVITDAEVVPEPGTLILVASALAAARLRRLRTRVRDSD